MKPEIKKTAFGRIWIDDEQYDHDVVIRLNGQVEKRKKKLSKAQYGTSHKLSLDEVRHVYEEGAEQLVIGSGYSGLVRLSEEAAAFLMEQGCQATLLRTPKALKAWNKATGAVIGLFHTTC
jgi:hypothetical protein